MSEAGNRATIEALVTAINARDLQALDKMPAQNQFWGDRTASIMDPAGHVWTIATRIEETTAEERTDRWSSIVAEQPSRGAPKR